MRRNNFDIILDILEVTKNGVNKTAIVYRTNLNFKLADKYLLLLQNQELLEKKADKYITSGKGNAFLDAGKKLKALL